MNDDAGVLRRASSFWRGLGPGLLFAAAGIGISHLVQSTRAGAVYGLGLVGIVILANLIRYPAFRFATHYASVTGKSLISGYRDVSPAGPWIFLLTIVPLFFVSMAAVTMVTAGLAISVLGLEMKTSHLASGIIVGGGILLAAGHYRWLETISKWMVLFLAVATATAAALALPGVDWSFYPATAPALELSSIVFIVALMGYMPTPMDVSVQLSLWTVARQRDRGRAPSAAQATLDFNIGYIGTSLLAICFLIMGAGIMHAGGIAVADSPVGFSDQLIDMYRTTLGPEAAWLTGAAAMVAMATTVLAVVDGMPRMVLATIRGALGKEPVPEEMPLDRTPAFYVTLTIIGLGAMVILNFFITSFRTFLDLGAGAAFLSAPIIATLNHLAVFRGLDEPDRPGPVLKMASIAGIAAMTIIAAGYVWVILSR